MRAAVIHSFGGPELLKIQERPEPALRQTDVLVQVHATSVNPVDTKVRAGRAIGKVAVIVRPPA